jgi:hypothetical protein
MPALALQPAEWAGSLCPVPFYRPLDTEYAAWTRIRSVIHTLATVLSVYLVVLSFSYYKKKPGVPHTIGCMHQVGISWPSPVVNNLLAQKTMHPVAVLPSRHH